MQYKCATQQVMLRDLSPDTQFPKTFKMTAYSVFWQIFATHLIPDPSGSLCLARSDEEEEGEGKRIMKRGFQ